MVCVAFLPTQVAIHDICEEILRASRQHISARIGPHAACVSEHTGGNIGHAFRLSRQKADPAHTFLGLIRGVASKRVHSVKDEHAVRLLPLACHCRPAGRAPPCRLCGKDDITAQFGLPYKEAKLC